ncbi:accessory regulator AgrB [Clostridium niameyense]|uniref:Accessory regulator AgrB n=1 Tax=Clostridium niameyense TaxID=1622073 RepID=A0A6M0RC26_9CLOT|nr:accessory gene regulator B family protein [Clostridium niameyense]NEZ47139.1 accessory regulator AgrB [Clostridium niameyense]
MYLIEVISDKVGNKITESLKLDEDSKEVIIYGTFVLIHTLSCILSIIIFGAIFNVFLESIIICICVSLLRKYSGGVHADSPGRCLVIGTVIIVGLAIIIKKIFCNFSYVFICTASLISLILCFYLVNKYAPVDSIQKPIEDVHQKEKFKRYSKVIISVSTLIVLILLGIYYKSKNNFILNFINCIYMGLLWQSFTLTSKGYIFVKKFDKLLEKVIKI